MSDDLIRALCLVAVLEGLVLFAAPRGWKQAALQLMRMPDRAVRVVGGLFVAAGLACLLLARSG